MEIFGIDVKLKGLYEYPEEISEYLPDEIRNDELEMKSFTMEQDLEQYGYELGVLGRSGGYWGIDLNNDIGIRDLLEFVIFEPERIDEEFLIEQMQRYLSEYHNIDSESDVDKVVKELLDVNGDSFLEFYGLEGIDDYEFTDNFKKCANEFTDTVKYFESKESMLDFLQSYTDIPEVKQYLDKQK